MKRWVFLILLLWAAGVSAQTRYVDFSAGSDLWDGTSKTHTSGTVGPWKSSPYMQSAAGCSDNGGNHFGYSHTAGQQIIFKGGVTWPAACFQMAIPLGGSSSSVRDYYGVDLTWFTGGAFTRPLFDLAGAIPTPVSGNHAVIRTSASAAVWITFDNIEIAHQQVTSAAIDSTCGGSAYDLGASGHIVVQKNFIHDWTQPGMANGTTSASQGGICQFGTPFGDNNAYNNIISDQSGPGNPAPFGGCFRNLNEVSGNECSFTGQGEVGIFGNVHDNYFHDLSNASVAFDPQIHTNGLETLSDSGFVYIYNNLLKNIQTAVNFDLCPAIGGIYNNVFDGSSSIPIQIDAGGGCSTTSTAVTNIFNNVILCPTGNSCYRNVTRSGFSYGTTNFKNNQFINDGSTMPVCTPAQSSSCAAGVFNQINTLTQSVAIAAGQGYTSASKYRASGSTVGAGANLTAQAMGGFAALASDTEGAAWFGASYVPRPTGSTAWDIGPYQSPFSGGGTPPTVTVTAPSAGTVSGTQTITVTASGGTISSIQPLVDNQTFGNACTASPCNVLWDTTKVSNGTHTVGGTATNGTGQNSATPVSVTVSNTAPGCSITSPSAWTNTSIATQTGAFNVGGSPMSIMPNGIPPSGSGGPVFALSQAATSVYGNNAVLVRQSENGFWEAYNPAVNGYAHTGSASWIVGTSMVPLLAVDIPNQRYSLQVTQNGVTTTIATNFAFRTTVTSLGFWNLDIASGPATLTVCNFTLGSTGQITPSSFGFGTVNVGSSASQVFTLTNNGGSPLSLSAYNLTPSVYTFTANNCPIGNLASGASCSMTVLFTPAGPTSYPGTLSVTTTGTVNTVSLSGTGNNISPPSAPGSLTATASGTSIGLSWAASTGTPNITYAVARGTVSGGPYTQIATGLTATSYTDSNLSNGTYFYRTTATNSAGTSPQSNEASATVSTSPLVLFSPNPLNFGVVGSGSHGSLNETVANVGNANLTLTCPGGVSISGANAADFAITTNGCASPTAAGSSFPLLITFTPTAMGVENATLCVTSNSPTSPDCIAMTGTAQALVNLSPTSLAFGSIYVKNGSSTKHVILTNNSGGTLTVSSVSVGTGQYAVTTTPSTNCGGSVANAGTCQLNVTFNPTSPGSKTDTVTIVTSAGTFTVPLTGSGTNRHVLKVEQLQRDSLWAIYRRETWLVKMYSQRS